MLVLPWIVSERHTVERGEVFRDAGPGSWVGGEALVWSHHTVHHWHPGKHGVPYHTGFTHCERTARTLTVGGYGGTVKKGLTCAVVRHAGAGCGRERPGALGVRHLWWWRWLARAGAEDGGEEILHVFALQLCDTGGPECVSNERRKKLQNVQLGFKTSQKKF